MFTDLFGYSLKAQLWTLALQNFDKTLPSYRQAHIHLANLERMIKKFEQKPLDLLEKMPDKKLRKLRGQYKRDVAQQDKQVDKSIRKLIEEEMLRTLNSTPGGQNIKAKQLRGAVQRRVASINRDVIQRGQRALGSYQAAAAALDGKP